MYIPRARERVFIDGRDGVYLVAWVDLDLQTADLIPLQVVTCLQESVPFAVLLPVRENLPLESA
jgi:hypothetical protein